LDQIACSTPWLINRRPAGSRTVSAYRLQAIITCCIKFLAGRRVLHTSVVRLALNANVFKTLKYDEREATNWTN